ncbi:MAG: DUF4150 domain-containing protein [Neisseriaceae bacterium]|nr:DUF4150 domain-containing protein [Neisseriaceae bacterium]
MATQKIARKDSQYRVVCMVPDFCFVPGVIPPIPFPLYTTLGSAGGVVKHVRLNKKPAFVFDQSKAPKTIGDQVGVRKGVVSRTVGKAAWPKDKSSDTKIGKKKIIRTGDMFWMNGNFSKGSRPHVVKPVACKCGLGVGRPVNPILGIKVLDDEVDFTFNGVVPLHWTRQYFSDVGSSSWLGQGWLTPYHKRLQRLEDGDFVYIDEQNRHFNLPSLLEDDVPVAEAVFVEAEQIYFARADNGRFVISNVDGRQHLLFAPLTLGADDPDGSTATDLVLVAMLDQNGNHTRLLYDAQTHRPMALIDSSDRYIQWHFANVAQSVKANVIPRLVALSWAPSVPEFGAVPPAGQVLVRYDYDEAGMLRAVLAPDETVRRRFTYQNGVMVAHEDAAGLISQYAYDDYSPQGKVIQNRTNLGESWTFAYHADHTVVVDALGREEQYHFDANQELVRHVYANGEQMLTERDHLGRALSMTDPLGRVTRYQYNLAGQVTSIMTPDQQMSQILYDDQNRLHEAIDPHGNVHSFNYDEVGNLVHHTDAQNQVTRYEYNEFGLPVLITNVTNGQNAFVYNAQKQLVRSVDCSGKATQYRYDERGQMTALIDALGHQHGYQYDEDGYLTRVSHPDGSSQQYVYDAAGRLLRHTDGMGRQTEYEYGLDHLPVRRRNALGEVFGYEYDVARRLTTLTNENGAQHHLAYDRLNNLIQQVGFDGQVSVYHHNQANELVQASEYGVVDPRQLDIKRQPALHTVVYQRDLMGRLVREDSHTPHDLYGGTRFYQYNDIGQLIQAQSEHSLIQLDYDTAGHILREATWSFAERQARPIEATLLDVHQAKVVQYRYDALGNRTTTILPDGRQLNYLHYGSGHVHQINLDGELISDIERDDLHREVQRSQGALNSDYQLSPLGLLQSQHATRQAVGGLGGPDKTAPLVARDVVHRQYRYNNAQQLTQVADARFGVTAYVYDAIDRVIQAGQETFAFDPASNIIDTDRAEQAASSQRDVKGNKVTEYQGVLYRYDDLGNMVCREHQATGESLLLSYDCHNQLSQAVIERPNQAPEKWQYYYDAFGRRLSKVGFEAAEQKIEFVWEGSRLLQEQHHNGSYTYVYQREGGYVPLAQLFIPAAAHETLAVKPFISYCHTDQIGLPREMTNEQGQLVWYAQYQTWGEVAEEVQVQPTHQPLRFQNQYHDAETGLHYNLLRYYEPRLGRFINQDPVGLAGGMNVYQYAPNPMSWIDPLGLSPEAFWLTDLLIGTIDGVSWNASAILGAAVGAHDYIGVNKDSAAYWVGSNILSNAQTIVMAGIAINSIVNISKINMDKAEGWRCNSRTSRKTKKKRVAAVRKSKGDAIKNELWKAGSSIALAWGGGQAVLAAGSAMLGG